MASEGLAEEKAPQTQRKNPHAIALPHPFSLPPTTRQTTAEDCYHYRVFNFGRPKTAGQWIGHFAMAVIALFLVWWMLRVYAH